MTAHALPKLVEAGAAPSVSDLIVERVRLRLGLADGSEAASPALASIEQQLAGPAGAAFSRLADLFRLSPADRDVLQTCVAASLDAGLADSFRRLTGRPYVSGGLVADLFRHPRGRVWNPGGSLAAWELVRSEVVGPGEPDVLSVDPVVPAWLGGELWIDRALAGVVRLVKQGVRLQSWPVDAAAATVKHALSIGTPVRILVSGDAGSGRTMYAAAAATAAGLTPLVVDTADLADDTWPNAFVRLQRLAAVGGLALIWTGPRASRPWPTVVSPAPAHFVLIEPGTELRAHPGAVTETIVLGEPSIGERRWAWTTAVPAARQWSESDLESLTQRYRLGLGDILTIAASEPATAEAAAALARACRRGQDDDVVQPMTCPFGWDDLILPAAVKQALEQFAFEASDREAVNEQVGAASRWLSRDLGLVGLFCGPSGCGKTMGAQVMAAHLGHELLRVNLAAVLSKYIGETAKNLNRIFAAARRRQAVLLFDEADTHFTRRTDVKDAHDRYANADTNHLLQLLESHRGVVILATNRRSDMDSAFTRRMRHVIEFPRPQAADRLTLWRQSVAAVAPRQSAGLSKRLARVAETVDLTGAQIKSAATTALFLSRRDRTAMTLAHIQRGIDRELANEGRPPSEGWSHA